jgi:hypothetical protein
VNDATVILLLYVDDLFLTGAEPLIIQCKRELSFGEIFLGKEKYVVKILQKFGMVDYKSTKTPMVTDLKKLRDSDPVDSSLYPQLIGSLIYLENTQSNI